MARLIDSNIWIDLARPKSSRELKACAFRIASSHGAALAEPVLFETLAYASEGEVRKMRALFDEYELLETPKDLWERATELGRKCSLQGEPAGQMDLLIATVAIHHDAEVVTFDAGMASISNHSKLRVTLLPRPKS